MYEQELIWIVKQLLLPPGGLVLMCLIGLMLSGRFIGKFLILLAIAALYLLSAPFFAQQLAQSLEQTPPLDPQSLNARQAQAIVVLGGGRYLQAPEYDGDTVNRLLLERLRYAAKLSRQTGLPVIPSGGSDWQQGKPEADLARQVLEKEYGVSVLAVENRSRTTWENARYTSELLNRLKIKKIILVSHAWHIPRALTVFRNLDIDITPAPTGYISQIGKQYSFWDWLPSAQAFQSSYWVLHEYLGEYWYRLRNT
ncbi:MAG: YdcF family protein [Sedimenticola sp.]|nr:MAG: YdcF family protein [Sedimenticola sp.]